MTVVENKLTNIRSKLLGTKAVNKTIVREIEDIVGKPIVSNKIDISRFTDNESRIYYNEALAAVDDELRNLSKVNVATMPEIIDLGDNLIKLLNKIKKYLTVIHLTGYNIDTNILEQNVFINDDVSRDVTIYTKVKDLELLYVINSRMDIFNDLFGEKVASEYKDIEYKGAQFDVPDGYNITTFNLFKWLLDLLYNKEKYIKHEMDVLFESSKLFNIKFDVYSIAHMFSNLENILEVLDIVIEFLKRRFTYESIQLFICKDYYYFERLEDLYKILDGDGFSLGLLNLIKDVQDD